MRQYPGAACLAAAAVFTLFASAARADAVIDWNIRANDVIVESKIGTPPAMRVMAIVQTSVHEAVQNAAPDGSIDAAVAAANRATLSKLLPAQQATIERFYQAAIGALPKSRATAAGIEAGEHAAAAILAARADDGAAAPAPYRPHAAAGALGAMLDAELGGTRGVVLSTSSPSAKNATRRWTSVAAFVQEVSDARIYEGIHFRSAVETGTAMGRQIGTLAAQRYFAQ